MCKGNIFNTIAQKVKNKSELSRPKKVNDFIKRIIFTAEFPKNARSQSFFAFFAVEKVK